MKCFPHQSIFTGYPYHHFHKVIACSIHLFSLKCAYFLITSKGVNTSFQLTTTTIERFPTNAIILLIPYSGKVWQGETLANWLFSSIWRNKVWRINISTNRLLIVSTNLDGFRLANHQFTKFAILSLLNFPTIQYNISNIQVTISGKYILNIYTELEVMRYVILLLLQ